MAHDLSLPPEVLHQIFSYSLSQSTLHACTLVSRAWYASSIEDLYDSPTITGRNYDAFVRSVCPSINAHIRHNGLAELIRRLDMSGLVHNGSKSLTARLLGRVKGSLEWLVAPQASFSINSLAPLSKCTHLQHLDLSLVTHYIPIPSLLRALHALPTLRTLHLPRAAPPSSQPPLPHQKEPHHPLPPSLRTLAITGGLRNFSFPPPTPPLTTLTITNTPNLSLQTLHTLLTATSLTLHTLTLTTQITTPPPNTPPFPWTTTTFPSLTDLTLSTNFPILYYTNTIHIPAYPPPSLPITTLHLASLPPTMSQTIAQTFPDNDQPNILDPRRFWDLCSDTGPLAALRRLEFDAGLRWVGAHWSSWFGDEMEELAELLRAYAREDGEGGSVREEEAGAFYIVPVVQAGGRLTRQCRSVESYRIGNR